jgi:acetylornithine deacetylase/succinyl-diaminopimelate desuccinylase-like protein
MLHPTAVPAVLKGTFKLKVFPAEAEAEINVRPLPDEDITAICAQMAKIIDDSSVTILPPGLTNRMRRAPSGSLHTSATTFETAHLRGQGRGTSQ